MNETAPVNIFLALPVDDGSRPQFWHSLMCLISSDIFPEHVSFSYSQNPGDSLITRARNNLAHSFLQSDCDYLLFIDTDIEFLPEQILRLIEMRRPDAVVCGQYAIKQNELRMCYTRIKGEEVGADGLLKVAEAGTGCMLIPRLIFDTYKEKFPDLEYTCEGFKDSRVSFFDVGVIQTTKDKRTYKSEEWLFCRRVRQLGFSVYIDTTFVLAHWGWAKYPLTDDDLIAAIASRIASEEVLQSYLEDIDKAARARWITNSQPSLTKP